MCKFLFRARISDACEVMRKIIPGMPDKTDKATVFEFAVRYIQILKGFLANMHEKVSSPLEVLFVKSMCIIDIMLYHVN